MKKSDFLIGFVVGFLLVLGYMIYQHIYHIAFYFGMLLGKLGF